MMEHLRLLWASRELLWMWSLREIKIRYKQSFFGVAWAILQPLALMVVFTIVFSILARIPTDGVPYPVFSYTAVLPWTFFSASISFAVPSLVNNMNLVTKISFPREVLPIAAVVAAFLDFLISSVVFFGLLIFYQVPLQSSLLWLPFLLAVQIVLTLGVVVPASALIVWYRDIRFVVPLGLQLWMYVSPVIYPASLVPERWRSLYMLNPMAVLIDSYRRVVLYGESPSLKHLGVSAAIALVLLLAGYVYFKRSEVLFADVI